MPVAHTVRHRTRQPGSSRKLHGDAHAAAAEDPAGPAPTSGALQASVLVLNRGYAAIHIVGVRRAFGLLYRELAEVIHLESLPPKAATFANYDFLSWREMSELRAGFKQPHEDWIRAVNFEIQVPRVIRLLGFDRLPRQRLHLNRRTVLARDEHCCQYCGRHFPAHELSLDHVIPRSRGGTTSWENVVCACLECNIHKGGRTPHEANMKIIRRPVRPQQNPVLLLKLSNPKYEVWKTWLNGSHWNLGIRGQGRGERE